LDVGARNVGGLVHGRPGSGSARAARGVGAGGGLSGGDPAAGSAEAQGSRAAAGGRVSDAQHPGGWRGRPGYCAARAGGDQACHGPAAGLFSVWGRSAFQWRTGWVLVREKVRWAPSGNSTVRVCRRRGRSRRCGRGCVRERVLPGDHDDSGGRGSALHGDRLDGGAWWGAGGASAAEFAGLVVGQGVGSVRRSSRVSGSKNISVAAWMRILIRRPARVSAPAAGMGPGKPGHR
jgi:hypothetical protein